MSVTRGRSHRLLGTSVTRRFRSLEDLELVDVPASGSAAATLAAYPARPDVVYAEVDATVHALDVPDARLVGALEPAEHRSDRWHFGRRHRRRPHLGHHPRAPRRRRGRR